MFKAICNDSYGNDVSNLDIYYDTENMQYIRKPYCEYCGMFLPNINYVSLEDAIADCKNTYYCDKHYLLCIYKENKIALLYIDEILNTNYYDLLSIKFLKEKFRSDLEYEINTIIEKELTDQQIEKILTLINI